MRRRSPRWTRRSFPRSAGVDGWFRGTEDPRPNPGPPRPGYSERERNTSYRRPVGLPRGTCPVRRTRSHRRTGRRDRPRGRQRRREIDAAHDPRRGRRRRCHRLGDPQPARRHDRLSRAGTRAGAGRDDPRLPLPAHRCRRGRTRHERRRRAPRRVRRGRLHPGPRTVAGARRRRPGRARREGGRRPRSGRRSRRSDDVALRWPGRARRVGGAAALALRRAPARRTDERPGSGGPRTARTVRRGDAHGTGGRQPRPRVPRAHRDGHRRTRSRATADLGLRGWVRGVSRRARGGAPTRA